MKLSTVIPLAALLTWQMSFEAARAALLLSSLLSNPQCLLPKLFFPIVPAIKGRYNSQKGFFTEGVI